MDPTEGRGDDQEEVEGKTEPAVKARAKGAYFDRDKVIAAARRKEMSWLDVTDVNFRETVREMAKLVTDIKTRPDFIQN